MLKFNIGKPNTTIVAERSIEGETIEQKIERIVTNREPITDGAPIIYMERKDGIQPQYDVRTDRWDLGLDAMDKVTKSKIAKRDNNLKEDKNSSSASSTQGTEQAGGAA